MKGSLIKNIFAAVGAFFVAMVVLVIALSMVVGGGISGDKVAVVELRGIIADPTDFQRELKELAERDDVKALIVRIDSPGGAVGPSQEIHGEIKKAAKTKTVVASMGSVAASGGYYAATAANKIVANPGTITGSIGVLVEFVNASELLSKIGLKGYVVKSGKFKDTGSPFRKMEAEEEALLQEVINNVKVQFVRDVAIGRNLKVEDVEKIADGRIFTGAQAKEKGLVDELGGLSDAIDLGAKLAGIEGKPRVIYPERRLGLFKSVFGDSMPDNITELLSGVRISYLAPGIRR